MRKFAAFILSNGRPDSVYTYKSLRECGYTGQIYIIIDDQDKFKNEYIKKYGPDVYIFDKKEVAKTVDSCNNFGKLNSVIYARNWNFELARQLGLTHFLQLDDDYKYFGWATNNNGDYIRNDVKTKQLDKIFQVCWDFLDNTPAEGIAFSQGGDFIGGENSQMIKFARQGKFYRKLMNSFFYRVDADIKIKGMGNDDVNLYVEQGLKGKLFVTIPRLRLEQGTTQCTAGGLTEMYKEMGTYVKSFYTVMIAPSCVKISTMGVSHRRIHHRVSWNNTVPLIINEKYKKQK